jgi:GDP-mannose transporter
MLLNKIALSHFNFHSANALLLFQCGLSAAAVQVCSMLGLVKVEPFSLRVAKVW